MTAKEKHNENKKQEKLSQARKEYIYGDIIREFKYSKDRHIREVYAFYYRLANEKWNKILKANYEKRKANKEEKR